LSKYLQRHEQNKAINSICLAGLPRARRVKTWLRLNLTLQFGVSSLSSPEEERALDGRGTLKHWNLILVCDQNLTNEKINMYLNSNAALKGSN